MNYGENGLRLALRLVHASKLLREWLCFEPYGPIGHCSHAGTAMTSAPAGCRKGVPRVVGRVPYRVDTGPSIYRVRASIYKARPVQ